MKKPRYRSDNQCVAMAKSTGKRCQRAPKDGFTVCRVHGAQPVGPDSTSFKHGAYSKHMKRFLGDLVEEIRNDPELMNLDDRVAEMSALRFKCQELLEERGIPADLNTVKILTDLLEKESRVIERKAKVEAMVRQAGIGDFTIKDFIQIVIQAEAVARKKLVSEAEKIIDVTPGKSKKKGKE